MRKQILDKLLIYVPATKIRHRPVERLKALGKKRDRSVNYLVCWQRSILEQFDVWFLSHRTPPQCTLSYTSRSMIA